MLTALAQGNSQITYNALKALGACVGTKAETALLETLRAAKEKRDVGNATNAAVSLARMAGADAVGHLATIYPKLPRTTPYGGVLAAVVYAFARHPSASTTALVRRELETTTMGQLGWAALNYLAKWGGADDVPRASRYLTQLLDRYETGVELFSYTMTQVDTKYTTELSASVALLCKDSAAALAPFKPRLRKHWDFFSAHDHAILKEYEPDTFAELQVSAHAVIRTIRTIRTVII
ncbi:MAG: hypothetical protein R2867_29460 [Caldilineaceae bacterium]